MYFCRADAAGECVMCLAKCLIKLKSSRIEAVITAQAKAISSLRTFLVLGMLVLAGLLAYLTLELVGKI